MRLVTGMQTPACDARVIFTFMMTGRSWITLDITLSSVLFKIDETTSTKVVSTTFLSYILSYSEKQILFATTKCLCMLRIKKRE